MNQELTILLEDLNKELLALCQVVQDVEKSSQEVLTAITKLCEN